MLSLDPLKVPLLDSNVESIFVEPTREQILSSEGYDGKDKDRFEKVGFVERVNLDTKALKRLAQLSESIKVKTFDVAQLRLELDQSREGHPEATSQLKETLSTLKEADIRQRNSQKRVEDFRKTLTNEKGIFIGTIEQQRWVEAREKEINDLEIISQEQFKDFYVEKKKLAAKGIEITKKTAALKIEEESLKINR